MTKSSLILLTDFYELTMACGYWQQAIHEREAVFHLFFRRPPFRGGFAIAAGLEAAIAALEGLRFGDEELAYLAAQTNGDGTPYFPTAFLDFLSGFEFTCDIDAVPEGTPVFAQEPLIRVRGPLFQAQLIETLLLNLVNFSTLIATKAARVCLAARGKSVLEFGLRRAQGVDGGLTATRSAYIGGCHATSNVLAGMRYGIPIRGTMAHSWVQAYGDELEAFRRFVEVFPKQSILLVDTYDTLKGVEHAIQIGQELRSRGEDLFGIRLDSGDLAYLSAQARQMLDDAGFIDTIIAASNSLDETLIADLIQQGAQIDVWGVGTNLSTGGTQSALGGVYKLSAVTDAQGRWQDRIKLSEQSAKISNPGILQIRRFHNGSYYTADGLYDVRFAPEAILRLYDPINSIRQKVIDPSWSHEDLLIPIFRKGKCVYELPSLEAIRSHTHEELSKFHPSILRLLNPHEYVVGMDQTLYRERSELIAKMRRNDGV